MNSWREIGLKGEELETKWKKNLDKKDIKIKEEVERLAKGDLPLSLDKVLGDEKLNFFQTKPKMATRQCSSSIIKTITNILR